MKKRYLLCILLLFRAWLESILTALNLIHLLLTKSLILMGSYGVPISNVLSKDIVIINDFFTNLVAFYVKK